MTLRLLWFNTILCLFCTQATGQQKELEVPRFTFHSPNVANLGKYGDYPVDASTGVPAIDIPLYTIKSSKLELPISLSYHASGIKVDQDASFVGLGWTLNAGGLVTRLVKDKPDEESNGFLYKGQSIPDYNSLDELEGAGRIGNDSSYLPAAFKQYDKEPDLFNMSAGKFKDLFCLNNTGRFVSMRLDSISYSVDLLNKVITIKDKNGTIYRFGKALNGTSAFETTGVTYSTFDIHSGAGPNSLSTYPSSYHLTEIISADYTDTISFKYKAGMHSDGKVITNTRYIMHDGNTDIIDDAGQFFDGSSFTTAQTTITNVQIPDKILFKNGFIEFATANDRLDLLGGGGLPGQTRITGFTVYDSKRTVIKKVLFQNGDYFNRTAVGNPMNNGVIQDYRKKSLKLNAVQFFDRDSAFINDYKFEYDPTPLPPRNTASQDFWGYYNGQANETLIPQTFFVDDYRGLPVYLGGNRKTNFDYMKAAVLTKLVYPTGGYTVYEYEPNYYLKSEQKENKVEQQKTVRLFAITPSSQCDAIDFLTGVPQNNSLDFQITEDLGSSNVSSANIYVAFSDFKVTPLGLGMTARISGTGSVDYTFTQTPSEKDQRKVVTQTVTIREGEQFRWEANTNGVTGSDLSLCNSPYIECGFSYKYWQIVPIDQVMPEQAGGLRAKSISNFDLNNNLIAKKIYEYGDTRYGAGVGNLITDPGKNFYNYPLLYREGTNKVLKNLLWFSSDSQVELGLNNGCPVDYGKVIEKTVSYNTGIPNGKTEYIYSGTTGDYEPKSSFMYPYNTVYYPEWKKNILLQENYYKYDNSSYVPVRSIKYQYREEPVSKIKILKIWEYQPDIYLGWLVSPSFGWTYQNNNPNRFYYYNYYVSLGRFVKTKETTTDYIAGSDSIMMERNMEYNKYHELSREWYVNSKLQTIEKIYKYTGDLDYTNLINQHMVSFPVQQELRLNGKVSSGTILKYNDHGGITERFLFSSPQPVSPTAYSTASNVPSPYEKRESVFYNLAKKTVEEIREENGSNTLYLWSYANSYPIAEIRNANYSDIQSVLGTAAIVDFSNKNPAPAEVQAFLAPLRTDTRLKTAMITTYVFDPLLGVLSMTDPRGQTTSYVYDTFGRLKAVKDQDGRILKQHDYQYRKPLTQ